jgi:hypothetical protein
MTVEELTAIATAPQSAISRHDQEMAEFRATLQQNSDRHDQKIDRIERLAELNQEQLNLLTVGLLERRTLVADYLQGRSQT